MQRKQAFPICISTYIPACILRLTRNGGCLAPIVVGVKSHALYIYIIRTYQRVLLSHLGGFNSATSIPPIMNNAPRNAVAGNLSPATRPTMPAQTGSPV